MKYTQELRKLGIYSAIFAAIMLFTFSSEGIMSNIRIILSFLWVFVLPGWSLLLLADDKLDSLPRFILAMPLSAAILGTASYYVALIGIDVHSHGWWMPAVVIAIAGILLSLRHTRQPKTQN